MSLNLTKHTGPMPWVEALSHIAPTLDSLYVVEFDWDDEMDDLADRFFTNNGLWFHGFIMPIDVIKQITVWKE
jgi:hypothetical protein